MKKESVVFVGQAFNESFGRRIQQAHDRTPANRQSDLLRRLDAHYALTGAVGVKLANMLGLERLEFLADYRRTNLNLMFPGKKGKGDAFDRVGGEAAAKQLMEDPTLERFVLLGSEVCKCFGVPYEHLMVWEFPRPGRILSFFCLPHPSGINLWYNDPKNRDQASRNLRKFVYGEKTESQVPSGIQMQGKH